jgi:hypothetical protein
MPSIGDFGKHRCDYILPVVLVHRGEPINTAKMDLWNHVSGDILRHRFYDFFAALAKTSGGKAKAMNEFTLGCGWGGWASMRPTS